MFQSGNAEEPRYELHIQGWSYVTSDVWDEKKVYVYVYNTASLFIFLRTFLLNGMSAIPFSKIVLCSSYYFMINKSCTNW